MVLRIRKNRRKRSANGDRRWSWNPQRLLLALVVTIVLTAILSVPLRPPGVPHQLGEISRVEIRAPRAATFLDTEATKALRQQAADTVEKQYDQVDTGALETLEVVFQQIEKVSADELRPEVEWKVTALEQALPVQIGPDSQTRRSLLELAVRLNPEVRRQLHQATRAVVQALLDRGLEDDTGALAHVRRDVALEADQRGWKDERRRLLIEVASAILTKPNRVYNPEKTEQLRREKADSIPPVRGQIGAGEVVLRAGEPVQQVHLDKLVALGLIQPRYDYLKTFFLGCLAAFWVLLWGLHLAQRLPRVYEDFSRLILLGLILAASFLAFKSADLLAYRIGIPQFSHVIMLCEATTGMFVMILLDFQLAVLLVVGSSCLLGIAAEGGLWILVEGLLSGLVAVYSVTRIVQRSHLMRAGAVVSLGNVLIVGVLGPLANRAFSEIGWDCFWGGINGVLSFAVVMSFIPFMERLFGLVTPFRLLELANPNEPLLRRLLAEAPGTYHASLIIGNLAEAAAEAIGADSLLARTGAYYHDIGKLNRPYCFVENQFGGENIHDRLKPGMSALVVKSHVKDGVEIAREHGLPQVLIDIIEQHHGTLMISFFYQQALQQRREDEEVSVDQFRYEGPKPQFREAGIIMLADAVEATVRAMEKVTPPKVAEMIERTIWSRLEDGQLEECDLTMRDLRTIAQTFETMLKGVFHSRMEYPEPLVAGSKEGGSRAAGPGSRDGRGGPSQGNGRPPRPPGEELGVENGDAHPQPAILSR